MEPTISNLIGDNVKGAFKRKLFNAITEYVLEYNENLKKVWVGIDRYPANKYLSLEEKLNKTSNKSNSKSSKNKISKQDKRQPITSDNELDKIEKKDEKEVEKKDEKEVEKKDEKEVEKKDEKKNNKTIPFSIKGNAKTIFEFIITRYKFEIKNSNQIEKEFPKNEEKIKKFLLTNVPLVFKDCNITELIIHNSDKYNLILENSRGLDEEIQKLFKSEISNTRVVLFATETLVKFIKIISSKLSNRFWMDSKTTVNKNILMNILMDLGVGLENTQTIFSGILEKANKYDLLINPIITKKEKSDNKKSDSKKPDSKLDNKPNY